MGVDLPKKTKIQSFRGRKKIGSRDPYLHLLIRLYKFLDRRASCQFNRQVLKALRSPRRVQGSVGIKRVIRNTRNRENATICVAGTVTNDNRVLETPKLSVCALKFTHTARSRIIKNGGECITFDQLALKSPTGANSVLLKSNYMGRKATKHFGGVPGSMVKPAHVRTSGGGRQHATIRHRMSRMHGPARRSSHLPKKVKA
eukprot:Trichotokara_eunicae@DN5972_c0_g1_i1.p1